MAIPAAATRVPRTSYHFLVLIRSAALRRRSDGYLVVAWRLMAA
jgi:hypothetical protein